MSVELKALLDKAAEEDYRRQKLEIEQDLECYRSLLLKIAKTKRWAVPFWVQGSRIRKMEKYEKALDLLKRANLVKEQMKFTEHNAYRVFQLTPIGSELVIKLQNNT